MSTPGGESTSTYTCPFCRMVNTDDGTPTCPRCGAPIDVRLRVSKSGWAEQPAIRDMARLKFNRSTCQISGTLVPVAEMKLDGEDSIYFSHHVLLHADEQVKLEPMKMAGGWNRMLAGMPLIMMSAQGPGHLAISADAPGDVLAIPLQHNQGVDVVEHKFLAGTGNVGYQWHNSNVWFTTWQETNDGGEEEWHYPLGQFIDRFVAQEKPGLLWLHAPGNTFVRDLQQGERILVQPSALIWKDPSVHMSLHFEYPRGQYWFSSARWEAKAIWLSLHGPGRVALQSVFERPETVGSVFNSSGSSTHYW